MKKMILGMALFLSMGAFAKTEAVVFPQVINLGYQVQIQIFNNTPQNVYCSGPITLMFQSGRRAYLSFYEMVWAGRSLYRTMNTPMNDRIMFVNHSIFCH